MGTRLELQTLLESLLGSRNVYFQPPPSLKMAYPCIVYERDNILINHAGNQPYRHTKRYSLTVIDRNPDSLIPDKISELPMCSYSTHFTADNLHHDAFSIYF